MMSWHEYKKYSRGWHGEEMFDFILYRPLAYALIKLTYSLPFTPNTFSLLGLLTALTSSYFMTQGTLTGLATGGIGILIFSVFDCCDGMLARMKKNSSPLGELVDMIVDLLSSTFFFVSTYIGVQKLNGDIWYHQLIIPAGFILLLHASIYHYYKKMFQFYRDGNPDGREREIDNFRRQLARIPRSQWHRRFLVKFYLLFTKLQSNPKRKVTFERESYITLNKQILPLWGVTSGSTHLTFLAVALLFNKISYFLYFSFVAASLWVIFVYTIQRGLNRNIEVTP